MISIPFQEQVNTFAPYVKGYCFHNISEDRKSLQFFPEKVFTEHFTKVPGQITRETPFGKELFALAKTGPSLWLEIGTWNGLGTTKCILDGFAERKDINQKPQLASIEIDPILFQAAAQNLQHHPVISCVKFFEGKLFSSKKTTFPTPEQLGEQEQTTPHFFIHYDRERNLYAEATPVVPPFAPQVAVLDGGEYSGYLDWIHLDKSELQILCLDDTNTTKNKKVIQELGEEWTCCVKGDDRNGWAIYKRSV